MSDRGRKVNLCLRERCPELRTVPGLETTCVNLGHQLLAREEILVTKEIHPVSSHWLQSDRGSSDHSLF